MLQEIDTLEREHKQILHAIRKYYETYPDANSISVDELRVYFDQQNPAIKNKEIYQVLFDQVNNLDISNPDLLTESLNQVAEYHCSVKAMAKLSEYLAGNSKEGISAIPSIIQEYENLVVGAGEDNPDECTDDLHDIMAEIKRDGLLWRLPWLNETIGPVYPGTLGHVLARPETGKTAFVVDNLTYFAWQLKDTELSVLYLTNEEKVKITRSRAYASLLNHPVPFLLGKDLAGVRRHFMEYGGKNIHFINGVTTIAKVEQNIMRYRPRVVIVDQGPKVEIPGNHSQVEARQILYNKYRGLADRYDLIFLTAGQADAAAENKKWITYNHIDGSKVGIPGECDYIIGIGRNEEDRDQSYRYITVSKNKLGQKQGRTTARLDVPLSRYQSI